jgi:ribosomal protein L7/L12
MAFNYNVLVTCLVACDEAIACVKEVGGSATSTQSVVDYVQAARVVLSNMLIDHVTSKSHNPSETPLNREEQDEARAGRKIPSIKLLRQRTSIGLKEAKESVEKWLVDNGYPYDWRGNTDTTYR